MLAHIAYHEGYVPIESNTVGSPDQEVSPENALWQECVLSPLSVPGCLEGEGSVLVPPMSEKVHPPLIHLVKRSEAPA